MWFGCARLNAGTWERQVAIQRTEYQQRMETLCAGIEEHCEGYVRVDKPKGGFFLWIELLVRFSLRQAPLFGVVRIFVVHAGTSVRVAWKSRMFTSPA